MTTTSAGYLLRGAMCLHRSCRPLLDPSGCSPYGCRLGCGRLRAVA